MPILDIDAVGCDLTRTHFSQTKATASLFESGSETQRNAVVIHDRLLQEILKSLESLRLVPANPVIFVLLSGSHPQAAVSCLRFMSGCASIQECSFEDGKLDATLHTVITRVFN